MKVKKILFAVFSALIFALMLSALELNKNALWGFVILLFVTAGFYTAHRFVVKRKNKWYAKFGVWFCWLALFVGILFLSWPPVRSVPAMRETV